MKNSIFKSYSKKILKSEAFISVIIVCVLAFGIIGSSYALYMDVDKDTNYQVMNVGDLAISFDNGDNTINLTNMTPSDDDIAKKQTDNIFSFYIYNTGSYTTDYDIKLVPLDGNEVDTQYINYQICVNNASNCDDVSTLSNRNDSIIYKDELTSKKTTDASNPSVYYFLRIWVNNNYEVSSVAKNIKLKVVVEAKNASGEKDSNNTLSGATLNNPNIAINNNIPDFNVVETNEVGLFKSQDDYGTSYYFRGASSYNYVNFANSMWRIVRINGDGSIRLIKSDSIGQSFYNSSSNNPAYQYYMYGDINSSNYDQYAEPINDSTVKTLIDTYYETNLAKYSSYMVDSIFCGEGISSKISLKCNSENSNYLRYTVDNQKLNDVDNYTNGALDYPIALLTSNEAIMAGGKYGATNQNYYLSQIMSWLITPNGYDETNNYSKDSLITTSENKSIWVESSNNTQKGVNPVINLKKNTVVTGSGTQNDPYVVK